MAVIADAFADKLMEVLENFVTDEVVMLLGVNDGLRRLQKRLQMIKAVLADAERIRLESRTIDLWLANLKDIMYDADDIMDLCRVKGRSLLQGESGELPDTTSSSVRTRCYRFPVFSSCCRSMTSIPFRHEIGKEIQSLNKRLEDIYEEGLILSIQFTSGGSDNRSQVRTMSQVSRVQTSPSDFVGERNEKLERRLVYSLVNTEVETLVVFAIVGLGGVGKTTLAQKIFSNEKVQGNFQAKCWVCVSQSYSAVELLKQIIRNMGGRYGQKNTTTELLPLLRLSLEGKRFLLVLDDMWTADVWEHLLRDPLREAGESSSRVLITSRNLDVARRMGSWHDEIHQVKMLDAMDGWTLLCKNVFENEADGDIQNLREIGMQIVEKCQGLPLAIKIIAGVLKGKGSKKSEWVEVYESQAWSAGRELPADVAGALYLSYADLPSQLKQCFLFFSLFPEDYIFDRLHFTRYWIAEGFISAQGDALLEDIAEDYFNNLISRSFLHSDMPDRNKCRMHDLIRSFAMFLTGDESYLADANKSTTTEFSRLRRLAIEDIEGSTVILNAIENPHCLRTLLAAKSVQIKAQDLLQRFTHLRILDLRESCIESIPESIRNLHHLRYLDLGHTNIHKLPESLGCLFNLQFLNLDLCKFLHTLPNSIAQLQNLRCLDLTETPVSFVPSGIGRLRNLNVLQGFVVGHDDNSCDPRQGCRLNELQSMSHLRTLHVRGLERAQMGGVRPLNDKCRLKELKLEGSRHADQSLISPLTEEIYESLYPPPNLETLEIISFLGNKFPTWICMLHNLTSLILHSCQSCNVLPPLGKLHQLRVLHISEASSVLTIGHEFLGLDVMDGVNEVPMTAFPKLEVLTMTDMLNLEEWIIDMKEIDYGRGRTIEMLPRLQKLELRACSKLKALPEGLRVASGLKDCTFAFNDSLREINNIPSLKELHVVFSRSLESISNLPSLEKLYARNCGCLESISNLPSLEKLDARNCGRLEIISKLPALGEMSLEFSEFSSVMFNSVERVGTLQKLELTWPGERLPDWLLQLLQESKANRSLQTFYLTCSQYLRERCSNGGQYWPLLSHIPDLTIQLATFQTGC